ncbi:MAG: hypothetical protein K5870_10740 [Lachnospiraceae bacterium]|nr:hypothetical protein [Lachnospiraceae bacterium]
MSGNIRLLSRNRVICCSKCKGNVKQIRSGEYECVNCGNIEYDDFGKVRKYLEENGPQTKEKIILETGVSREVVNEFLAEQRLEVAPHSEKTLKCTVCGKPIQSGLICSACLKASVPKSGYVVSTRSDDEKMRFL